MIFRLFVHHWKKVKFQYIFLKSQSKVRTTSMQIHQGACLAMVWKNNDLPRFSWFCDFHRPGGRPSGRPGDHADGWPAGLAADQAAGRATGRAAGRRASGRSSGREAWYVVFWKIFQYFRRRWKKWNLGLFFWKSRLKHRTTCSKSRQNHLGHVLRWFGKIMIFQLFHDFFEISSKYRFGANQHSTETSVRITFFRNKNFYPKTSP